MTRTSAGRSETLRLLLAFHHRHGDARDADELAILVADLDSPHLTSATHVKGTRSPGYQPRRSRAKGIGVDLLSNADVLRDIHTEIRGETANGLRQCHRCA